MNDEEGWKVYNAEDYQKIKQLEAEVARLRELANRYLAQYGRPRRDEWINDNGFNQAESLYHDACSILGEIVARECEACEGSGETGHQHHDGTWYSDRNPPCQACNGTGRATADGGTGR